MLRARSNAHWGAGLLNVYGTKSTTRISNGEARCTGGLQPFAQLFGFLLGIFSYSD